VSRPRRALPRIAALGAVLLAAALALPAAADTMRERMDAGDRALAAGRYDAAREAYRAVLRAQPRNREAMRRLGAADLADGRLEDAFSTLQTLRVLAPEDAGVRLSLARVYREAGLADRERRALLEAIRLDPGMTEAHLGLARAFVAAEELFAAGSEYAWLIADADRAGRPPEPVVLFELAAVRERLGRPADAARLLTRYLALAPSGELADRARAALARLPAPKPAAAPGPPAAEPGAAP
jgi:tetratricopeptide (TPR) repeat protein